jgi:hypothetical protein
MELRKSREDLGKIPLSNFALSQLQRTETKTENRGQGKSAQVIVYSVKKGSALAEKLSMYLTNSTAAPESQPFYALILSMLHLVASRVPEGWTPPKQIFEAPAESLKREVRRGPRIAKKGGREKTNLYVPLSFVKSAECSAYPANTKRILIEIGASVIGNLNKINASDVRGAIEKIDFYREYIRTAYAISDHCRNQWRLNIRVPSYPEKIRELLVSEFENCEVKKTLPIQDYITKLKLNADNILFKPAFSSSQEMDSTRAQIEKVITERKESRKNPRSSAK